MKDRDIKPLEFEIYLTKIKLELANKVKKSFESGDKEEIIRVQSGLLNIAAANISLLVTLHTKGKDDIEKTTDEFMETVKKAVDAYSKEYLKVLERAIKNKDNKIIQ
jgi:molybdopterin synthase catalytic subunit